MTTEVATQRGHAGAEAINALSIGEVADQYGVTINALRYWDRLGILSVQRVGSVRVYSKDDLEKLGVIQNLHGRGFRAKEIRLALELDSLLQRPAISGTRLLKDLMAKAERGTTIQEPLPNKRVYNSAYRRLERAAKAAGRKVIIRTSEDERSLEARIVE